LQGPFAGVIFGNELLVTEAGAARVARLNLATGASLGTFGEGTLRSPLCFAVGPSGDVAVTCETSKQVHLFDKRLQPLRSIGQGLLLNSYGVSIDGRGRVYVADGDSNIVVVFDGANGAKLATIAAQGRAQGVVVTHSGQIIVSDTGRRLVVIG
jgi:DNA-binding beta-propeller fold protein YncE